MQDLYRTFEKETVPALMHEAGALIDALVKRKICASDQNTTTPDRSQLWTLCLMECLRRRGIPYCAMGGSRVAKAAAPDYPRMVLKCGVWTPDNELPPLYKEVEDKVPPEVFLTIHLRFMQAGPEKQIQASFHNETNDTWYGFSNQDYFWLALRKSLLGGGQPISALDDLRKCPDPLAHLKGNSDYCFIDPFNWAMPFIIPGSKKSKPHAKAGDEEMAVCPKDTDKRARFLCMSNAIVDQEYSVEPLSPLSIAVICKELHGACPDLFSPTWITKA